MIFSLKILKNYIYDVIFGAVDILSTGSLIFYTGLITDNASVSFPHIPSIVIIADFILHCPFRFISRTVKSAEFLNIFFRVEIFSFNELYI